MTDNTIKAVISEGPLEGRKIIFRWGDNQRDGRWETAAIEIEGRMVRWDLARQILSSPAAGGPT